MRLVRQLPIVVVALGAVACTAILGNFEIGPGSGTTGGDGGLPESSGPPTITPLDSKMGILRSQTFTASLDVTWSIDEGDVAGAIDASGVFLSGPTPGTYHVTATSKADPTQKATTSVVVVNLGVNVLVGTNGGQGNIDGTALHAHFSRPEAAIGFYDQTAQSNTYYIADTQNHTIRRYDESGISPKVTTIAGLPGAAGGQDGKGDQARFNKPNGLAANIGAKQLFVLDSQGTCIRVVDLLTNDVKTVAGRCGATGTTNGAPGNPPTPAEFGAVTAMGIASDNSGLFVCDSSRIRRIELAAANGRGTAQDVSPGGGYCSALAVSQYGQVFSASGNAVYRFQETGPFPLTAAQLPQFATAPNYVDSLAVDYGNLYASTSGSAIMRMANPSSAGAVFDANLYTGDLTQRGYVDGPLASARFNYLGKLATYQNGGELIIPDSSTNAIRRVRNAMNVETFVGAASNPGNVNGPRAQVKMTGPFAVTTDENGTIYFGDILFDGGNGAGNSTIRKYDRNAAVASTLAGLPTRPFDAANPPVDGPGNQARFWFPIDITYAKGKIYVVDSFAQAIRTVDTATGVVGTLAGEKMVGGNSDGVGAAAHFQFVVAQSSSGGGVLGGAIATDGTNLYLSDTSNFAIRKVVIATGETTTLAGGTVGLQNGTGKAAQFNMPMGIAYDNGFLYVTEWFDHVIRRINVSTGAVDTFMGLAGQAGDKDGDSATATLNFPFRLAADGLGNLYVAELPLTAQQPAGFVRRIDLKTKKISAFAGTVGQAGLQSGPLRSTLGCPTSLSLLPNKDMVFGDFCDLSIGSIEPL